MDAVKGQDTSVNAFPHSLPICVPALNQRSQSADELWVGDGDLEIWTLLVALEAEHVLSKDHLHGMNSSVVTRHLRLKISLEAFAVIFAKGNGSGNVEVVEEVGDMEEHRVTSL